MLCRPLLIYRIILAQVFKWQCTKHELINSETDQINYNRNFRYWTVPVHLTWVQENVI